MTIIDDWKALHKFDKYATVIFALVLVILGVYCRDLIVLPLLVIIPLSAFIILEGIRIKKPFLCITQAMVLNLLYSFPSLLHTYPYGDIAYILFLWLLWTSLTVPLAFFTAKIAGSYEIKKVEATLNEDNYDNAVNLAKEAEGEALKRKKDYDTYKETQDFISTIESEITKLKSSGVKIPKAEEMIAQAKSELNKNKIERAKELATEAKNIASKRKELYETALKSVTSASKGINAAKSVEIEVSSVENLLNKARYLLENGKYEEALELSKQAEEEALKLNKDYNAYAQTSEFIASIESEITELKSSGVKIPKVEELIARAKSELNRNIFERAKELANEANDLALDNKSRYDLAFNSISEAERMVNEAKDKGVMISSELLTKSKHAFDIGNYDESVRLSKELKNLASDRARICREAQEAIKATESSIENAKEIGCVLPDAEESFRNAEQLFTDGAYEEVIEISKQIEEQTKKLKQESKPEIAIVLAQTSFKPNTWKRIDLTITNTGTATAKTIKVDYPEDRVDIEGQMAIEVLKPSAEQKLKIGFRPIQVGEVPLKAKISYKDLDDKDYNEEQTFWISVGERIEEKPQAAIEIKRGYEILQNNDLRFGIRIINNTDSAIMDVETMLDYPRNLLALKGNMVQTLANIHPNGKRTAKYILTPLGCIHNEKIEATIFYKDHSGEKQTVQMHPKDVHCVCPFLKEKAMREGEFAELANACERIEEGLSFRGIGVNELTAFIKESCAHRLYVISEHEIETTKIVYLAGESIGEKACYLLTAVIQPYKNLTQIALRAHSDKPYGLHGFLNEIANSIRHLVGSVQSAKEIGIIENKQVITIIDSVVQRTSFGGSREGETSVNIEASVVQRTEIGLIRKCQNCEKEVQSDEKFCKECGAKLA